MKTIIDTLISIVRDFIVPRIRISANMKPNELSELLSYRKNRGKFFKNLKKYFSICYILKFIKKTITPPKIIYSLAVFWLYEFFEVIGELVKHSSWQKAFFNFNKAIVNFILSLNGVGLILFSILAITLTVFSILFIFTREEKYNQNGRESPDPNLTESIINEGFYNNSSEKKHSTIAPPYIKKKKGIKLTLLSSKEIMKRITKYKIKRHGKTHKKFIFTTMPPSQNGRFYLDIMCGIK